ncbi:bone morphogenetic protein receptor type-2-like [Notolabrus celidotus]|uniref:bone morphogenetic protein receptor type-2-like n=1 Tax=Notolabrus celidotus TaxID=1203425 RepID=UPI00148FC635|nr:bone morphogenetic protein receptor type-2-like [Notolabrus celidotus]
MAAVCGAVISACVSVLLLSAVSGFQSEAIECSYTDHQQGAETYSGLPNEMRGVLQENGTIRCSRGSSCYGLWEIKADGEIRLEKQGCWTTIGTQQQCLRDRCLVTATPSKSKIQIQIGSYRFCCCSRNLCNTNFTEAPPTAETPARLSDHRPLRRGETALIALVTVAIAAVFIGALFLVYRMMRGKQKFSLSTLDVMEAANSDSNVDLDNLKLLELIGRGRYGTVFRGSLNERCVAVKLFSSANRQNYANERYIYCLPLLQQHDNIARFLTADERTTADGRPEFLILMEYYPHGCLSHYLSLHSVDWTTCCRMTHGVTRGLAFLHTELYRGDQYKPPVAHRDVTSRNVLVRADLSCVLADFGLSMRLTGSLPCRPGEEDTMAISEVGTVRYMAPEVLGGALNLRDCEAALKQVDVYALGLLYWESFRRCSQLFPGEAVPEYQLAFQAELGNHPSFEEMLILVAREKFRPRFPEVWKENSLALRSLKETMEDCWDQDADARLTAQCAEERLAELTLLTTHTAIHNNRNLSHGRWPPQAGSSSSYIEDLQVGVVKNLQGDGHAAAAVIKTTGGPEGSERNRNSINYERQQAQVRSSNPDSCVTSVLTPSSFLCSISESELTGRAVPSVPVCLQLTEEDLEATKLDPREVDKNLRESSDENLMEHSQKQFGSTEQQTNNLLFQQILQTTEVNHSVLTPQRDLGDVGGFDSPLSSIHPLPKQQNLPQRPTSLHLLQKSKETASACSRLKLGKLKSNHRQVETGVAKMNTVTVATAVEPQVVTTVTNNTGTRASVTAGNQTVVAPTGHSAGVPTLVTNSVMGGGRTNPAGPQLEDDNTEGGIIVGDDNRMNLLNSSPDEHEPLLRREEPPAESDPPPPHLHHHHHQARAENLLTGQGSNSNNNNNRIPLGSDIRTQCAQRKRLTDPEDQQDGEYPTTAPFTDQDDIMLSNPSRPGCRDQDPGSVSSSERSSEVRDPDDAGTPDQVHTASSKAIFMEASAPETQAPTASSSVPGDLVLNLNVSPLEVQAPNNPAPETLQVQEPQESKSPPFGLQSSVRLRSQMGPAKAKRPQRPCSLDLSMTCVSSDDVSLMDEGSLSASGEKIKRRVKTPYTLKKWRPASWVVPSDTTFDPEFEFNTCDSSSIQTHFSSGPLRAGSFGIPKINQSKSSTAVFLVGGGATATMTSEPDEMTCF